MFFNSLRVEHLGSAQTSVAMWYVMLKILLWHHILHGQLFSALQRNSAEGFFDPRISRSKQNSKKKTSGVAHSSSMHYPMIEPGQPEPRFTAAAPGGHQDLK